MGFQQSVSGHILPFQMLPRHRHALHQPDWRKGTHNQLVKAHPEKQICKIFALGTINSTSQKISIPEQQIMTKYHYQHQHQPPRDQKNLHGSQ
jgi:hypothetical protein